MLSAATNSGNTDEILVGEYGVVVCQQCGALPLREAGGEQRVDAVGAAVDAEADGGGASVIGVLNEFLEYGGALRVVDQNLSDPARQIDLLPEVFQKDRPRFHFPPAIGGSEVSLCEQVDRSFNRRWNFHGVGQKIRVCFQAEENFYEMKELLWQSDISFSRRCISFIRL